MKEFVGVKCPTDIMVDVILSNLPRHSILKREALLFEKIVLPEIERYLSVIGTQEELFSGIIDDLEWLLEAGIVLDAEFIQEIELIQNEEFEIATALGGGLGRAISKVFNEVSHEMKLDTINLEDIKDKDTVREIAMKIVDFIPAMSCLGELVSRSVSIQLRELSQIDAYPILSPNHFPLQFFQRTKSDVLQVIVGTLPVPDESTSWEQILDYRSDPASKGKFLALRVWINEITNSQLKPSEIEEKLEWLVYDYQKHLELHRIKANTGTLETFIITTAEIVEDIVKARWSNAAKTLFSLKHRKAALMEAELNSPGREVAYIFDTRKKFS